MQVQFDQTIISVTHADRRTLQRAAAQAFAARQGFAPATINLDHLVKLRRDPAGADAGGAAPAVA